MKTKLCIAFLFALISASLFSQKQIETPYDFPVKPGMAEWAAFETGQEMVDACQIPEDILSQLSTKALVETCLNYPLKYDYLAYNDVRSGISNIIYSFNGYQELSKRVDAPSELITAYHNIPIITKLSNVRSHDENLIKIEFVELLIADDLFFQQFKKEDCMNLKSIMLKKYMEKTDSPKLYGLFNVQKTLLLGTKILEKANESKLTIDDKENLSKFIQEFDTASPQLIENISKTISQ